MQERIRVPTSISDDNSYPQFCIDAINHFEIFSNFRRNPAYNAVLEHVSFEQGDSYLKILSEDREVFSQIGEFKRNDDYGNPIVQEYPGVGALSPTTLRYAKVLADLKRHFGSLDGMSICEIGVGYGGQCRVINAFFKPESYVLIDIKPALGLAQKFLDYFVLNSQMSYRTMNELPKSRYDLVISNYSLSEMPRSIQDAYINKVVSSSRRGYVTYNDICPAHFNSYKAEELVRIIPGAVRLDEEPLTHSDNCVIVWGTTAGSHG